MTATDPRTNLLKLAERFEQAGQHESAAEVRFQVKQYDVELQLYFDRLIYGNSFCLERADGKVRLDPTKVTFSTEPDDA